MPQACLEQARRSTGMVCMPQTCLEQVRRLVCVQANTVWNQPCPAGAVN
jgi:hypothetical protein